MPQQVEDSRYVGCPWCTRGNVPVWRHDPNLPDGGEFVHTVRTKIDAQSETVSVTVCQAWKPTNTEIK